MVMVISWAQFFAQTRERDILGSSKVGCEYRKIAFENIKIQVSLLLVHFIFAGILSTVELGKFHTYEEDT